MRKYRLFMLYVIGLLFAGSGSVSGQQPNFSLVNLGGPQGQQILIQRAAVSGTNIQAGPGQTNLILRTVTPSPLLQQSAQHLQTTASTAQTVNMTSAQACCFFKNILHISILIIF